MDRAGVQTEMSTLGTFYFHFRKKHTKASLSTINQTSMAPFPFLQLPAELRFSIYKHLPSTKYPALALCARQIQQEIQPLIYYYGTLILDFTRSPTPYRLLSDLPESAGANIQRALLHVCEPHIIIARNLDEPNLQGSFELLLDKVTGLDELTAIYHVPDKSALYLRGNRRMAIHRLRSFIEKRYFGNFTDTRHAQQGLPQSGQATFKRTRLIIACGNDLLGADWAFEEFSKMLANPEQLKNPAQHLEVWIPKSTVTDPVGLAENLKSGLQPSYDDYRNWEWWDSSYWIRHLAKVNYGYDSVRFMRYDHEARVKRQGWSVEPLEVEGLQEFLDKKMLLRRP